MRSLKLWAVIPIAFLALLCVFSAEARVTVFTWDADPSWPTGTTIELEANGATATGITATQYALDVPVQPGEVINARARAIPPDGSLCSDPPELCQPSPWTTLVQTLPSVPAGLWARWTRVDDPPMTIARRGSTDYSGQAEDVGTFTLTKEPSVQVGDILLIGVSAYSYHGSTPGLVTVTGFTQLQSVEYENYGNGSASRGTVLYRVVDGTEGSSFTVTILNTSHPYAGGVLMAFSGNSLSIEDSGTTDNASGTSPSAPSVTAAGSNTMLLSFFLYSDPASFTAPTGSDGSFANSPQNTNGAAVSWEAISSSGATGTRTATLGTARDCLGVSVLLKETGGGGPQALAGDAATVASATGAVQMALPVASTSASVATAAGSLSIALPLQAAASVIASATGGVTMQLSMAGSALSEVLASGALGLTMPLAGDAASEATTTGDLTTGGEADLSGGATVESAGTGQITLSMALSGAAISEAIAAAGITLESALAAQAVAQAAGAGAIEHTTDLAGDAVAEAAGVADAGMNLPLSGGAQGQQTATGDLTALAEGALAGNAAAIISASGLFGMTIPIAGDAQVLATAGGSLGMNMAVAGDASAVMLSTGNLQISLGIPLEAAALAVATAGGSLSMTIPLDAVALAQATATGALSGGVESYVAYPPRTWTPGFIPRVWEPSAMNRTWMASASNRVWH